MRNSLNKKSLKIAQIAPIAERVPPKKYGGTERVISTLTEGLVKRGHKVTLFATGDSQTSARLISVYRRSLREAKIKDPYGLNEWTILHVGNAYEMEEEFDIIHDHNSIFGLPTAQFAKTPTIITIHGLITPVLRRLYEKFSRPHYVSVSKSQTAHLQDLKIESCIYNGLNMEDYPFSKENKGYLLFVGRLSIDKGVHHAIDVAQDLDLPLIIAAKLDDVDRHYFRSYIEPRLFDEQVKWIGEVSDSERNKLMSEAIALLHPVTWREPFGMVMIEAMACGCPVIAFNKGSIPEIIVNGKTGFVVNDVEEMIGAVLKVNQIDRKECRRYSLATFSAEEMVGKYEKIYEKILNNYN